MKRFKLLILSILLMIFFTGCSAVVALANIVDPNRVGNTGDNRFFLEELMNHPKKQLLSEDEKNKASQAICELKHLDKRKNINDKEAKKFCKLEKDDKIYFYDWCNECGGAINTKDTSYLLVRDGKPFESVRVEKKYSKELGRNIPIIERLH